MSTASVTSPASAHTNPTPDHDAALDAFAEAFSIQRRSPVLHRPTEAGLAFEAVTFPARDGVPLEGWVIPAEKPRAVVIANHPMGFTRSGMPTHLQPWHAAWSSSGNGFEIDFIPDYKILHDEGYTVVAYDLRNHGLSGAGNGGLTSSGIFEARDVAGSIDFVHSQAQFDGLPIALFSRCLGCSSTLAAAQQFPDAFADVSCLIGVQPVTARTIIGRRLGAIGLADRIDDLEQRIILRTGIPFDERAPQEWAKHVRIPTYLYQVRDDVLTEPADVQTIFDNLPTTEKHLQWIAGSTARWDGYLEFQRRPEPMLAWLRRYLAD